MTSTDTYFPVAMRSARPRTARISVCSGICAEAARSEEHTSELQSHLNLVCRLLLEKKKERCARTSRRTPADAHTITSIYPAPALTRRPEVHHTDGGIEPLRMRTLVALYVPDHASST